MKPIKHIFLAEDDEDDRSLFKDILDELDISVQLTILNNGEDLMKALLEAEVCPDLLFLDLNMPLKNGFECLKEIKQTEKFSHMPVIVISTCSNYTTIDKTRKHGALHYICKPNSYTQFKNIIAGIFDIDWHNKIMQPDIEDFVLLAK